MTHFPKSLHCVWAGVVAVLLNTPFFMQAAPVTTNYSYNSAGFLAAVNRNGAVIASYNYDANGNVTSVVTPAGSTSYAYDAQDRLLTAGATSFTYTDAGEMKTRVTPNGTTSYSYDEFGQLRHVSLPDGRNLDYVLGSPEMRIAKKVNGAVVQGFLRDEKGDILAELDGGNTVVSRFVYSELSATPESMIRGTDTFRIITDALGSVRLVMHAQTGAIAQRIDYDEWGQVTLDTNPGFQPFGYAGGLYDKDTGLVRFGERDYDPGIRRWTSPDPINFSGGSTNLYAYVNNDPLNLADPSGLGPHHGRVALDPGEDVLVVRLKGRLESSVDNGRTWQPIFTSRLVGSEDLVRTVGPDSVGRLETINPRIFSKENWGPGRVGIIPRNTVVQFTRGTSEEGTVNLIPRLYTPPPPTLHRFFHGDRFETNTKHGVIAAQG